MIVTREVALRLARENGIANPSSSAINRFAQAAADLTNKEIEQLTARVRELEEENASLKAECDDIKQVQFPRKLEAVAAGWKKQLAASQLHAEQLREALNVATSICWSNFSEAQEVVLEKALALPRDTSALDAYVTSQREAAYQEARRAAAQFEAELTRQRDNLLAQVDLAVEALERLACLGNGNKYGNSMGNSIAIGALRAIKESEGK